LPYDGLYNASWEKPYFTGCTAIVKQWLGPYDALILAKAPLFSVWLSMVHMLHVPLRLANSP
jgi:hypothetical protein